MASARELLAIASASSMASSWPAGVQIYCVWRAEDAESTNLDAKV